ncbi:MAG TPA: DUF3467 domain-containing protein [Mycobacteriales bacterium]|nr:DUF3467 domain-containing protein [Mycobacteriales bacterium]
MTEPEATSLEIDVPAEHEVGVYANCVSMWFTATELAIDFAAMLPSELGVDGELRHRARVVSRVKLPPQQAFEVIRAMNDTLGRYEAEFGGTGQSDLGHPLYPPEGP